MSCNRGAHEATAALAGVGVPAGQVMAVYGTKRVGMTWEYLPRCPHCKKWVSPRTGVCNYAWCKGQGTQVIEPTGWPPEGARIVRRKSEAQRVKESIRLEGYGRLEGLPPLGAMNTEEMETIFDDALGGVPAEVTAEDEEAWRREAARFLDFAAGHGVWLPISGQRMSLEEAYAYSRLGSRVAYPGDAVAEAEEVAAAALSIDDDVFAASAAGDAPPPPKNLNDHRIDPEADGIGEGGPKEKYRRNVEAIRLLKQLEEEDREATPEEKKVLARYVGWGGLAKVFDYSQGYTWGGRVPEWHKEHKEMKELLTEEEWESARATTPNAHYTSVEVIRAMWKGLERLGFEGGNVLEPSAGVGHFLGLMPEGMTRQSNRVAVEIDNLTGRILRELYPDSDVHIAGYEETTIPRDSIDAAVGNVPFGNYGVYDPDFDTPSKRHLSDRIHNYFFARALKDVKPGGVVAFITSHYTLDGKDKRMREYLASQADLVGAIRLPNTAFKGNAGTEVTTDIIFLRKRAEGDEPGDTSWVETVEIEMKDKHDLPVKVSVNRYFNEHPEMMLGTLEATGTMYRSGELTLTPHEGQNLGEALDEVIQRLPENIITPPARERCAECGAFKAAGGVCNNPMCPSRRPEALEPEKVSISEVKERGHIVKDGKVYRRGKGKVTEVKVKPGEAKRIAGMLEIRDAARQVLNFNVRGTDAELVVAQGQLGALYDRFVAEYGPLSDRKNTRLLAKDPDLPLLLALEEFDPETKTFKKADIFSRRTVQVYRPPEKVDTAKDALLVSLNETGGLEWGRMAALYGKSTREIQNELLDEGLVFNDPEKGFVTAEEYLSGNIRNKLAAAEAAARLDKAYERNVAALRKVMPQDVPYTDIKAQLGAGWIPAEYVQAFITTRLGLRAVKVDYLDSSGEFVIEKDRYFSRHSVANTTTWGAGGVQAIKLVEYALQGKTPKVYHPAEEGEKRVVDQESTLAAREMLSKIKQEFEAWVWEDDERRNDLEGRFNRLYNSVVPRRYDGSHMVLPGMNAALTMRPHQKDSIWRIAQSQENVLLGHIVGSGKTYSMIGGGMEYRRLNGGSVMHVVPNHMLDQYAADVRQMYPAAKVLSVSAKDIGKAEKRAEVMNRMATGNWDAVVVTHDAFNRIPLKPETEASFIRQELQNLEAQLSELKAGAGRRGRSRSVKQIEKAKKRLETKLKRALSRRAKDDYGLTFEDLGLGMICVDEAHLYKNLEVYTRRDRLAGIPQGGSARAYDMYMKAQYMTRRCRCGKFVGDDGVCRSCWGKTKITKGKVVFATGTPIANSMAEAYVMQMMLMRDRLKELGLHHFDNWASMFGATQTALEMKPSGNGYREFTRWSKFHNVPELMSLFRTGADLRTDPDKLGIPRPALKGGETAGVSVPSSPWLEEFIRECSDRAENLGNVDPTEDNMLKIVSDARKAALDPRLIDPSLPDDPNSKVNAAVRKMLQIHKDTAGVVVPGQKESGPQNMAQMVFLDMSTPTNGRQHRYYQYLKGLFGAGREAEKAAAQFVLDSWPMTDKKEAQDDLAAALVEQRASEGEARRLARQFIADNWGDSDGGDFNVYDDIKLKLIVGGVPEDEIAFIHDAKNDAQKLKLFEQVNKGEVRFLLGSTGKMGTGTNAQQRLYAMHHLDAPWRPADVEQREGRILRQGNLNPEVEIYRYVTEGSFDTYMWQTLETKARFIAQLMNDPDNPLREVEDLDALVIGYAQMKALATGNPIIIEQIELETKMRKLRALRRAHVNRTREIEMSIRDIEGSLAAYRKSLAKWKRVKAEAGPPLASFTVELNGKRYGAKTKADAGKVFLDQIEAYSNTTRRGVVGQINGYNIHLRGQGWGYAPQAYLEFEPGVLAPFNIGTHGTRNMTRLMKTANTYADGQIAYLGDSITRSEGELAQYRAEVDKPFEQEEEYTVTQRRLWEIEAELARMDKAQEEMLLRSAEEGDGKTTITGEAMDDATRFE